MKIIHKIPLKMMKYLLKDNLNNNYIQKISREIGMPITTLRVHLDLFFDHGIIIIEEKRKNKKMKYIRLTDKGKMIAEKLIKLDKLFK